MLAFFAGADGTRAAVMDPHKTVLPIYALPDSAAADGDLSEWRGVPGTGPENFKFVDRDEAVKPSPDFAPSFYAGRKPNSPDLFLLVVVRARFTKGEENSGWMRGSYLELYLDFGREARDKANPEWWKENKWNGIPEMSQFGFLPRTVFGDTKALRSGSTRDWKVDCVSVPVEGGVAYEIRVDGKNVLDTLKLPALPGVIGIDLGLMACDYPVLLEGGTWLNHRGYFRLFGNHTAYVNPTFYGGLSTVPVAPPAGELPARTLPSLYGNVKTLEELRQAAATLKGDALADALYWAGCQGVAPDVALVRTLMANAAPRVRETCLTVLSAPKQDPAARNEGVALAYADPAGNTPQGLVLANLLTDQFMLGHGPALVSLLTSADWTVAFTAAAALAKNGSAADFAAFEGVLRQIEADAGKDEAAKKRAAVAHVFMQPALDLLTFRVHPPPLPQAAPPRQLEKRNSDLYRIMPPDNSTAYDAAGLLRAWPKDGPKELWRFEVGTGYAAVTEAAGRAFAMGNFEDKQYAFCLDALKGTLLWKHLLVPKKSAYAAPTSLVDGDRVYFVAEGAVVCLNTVDGSELWREEKAFTGGGFSTPLIVGDTLFIAQSLTAVDKLTGKVLWKTPGPAGGPASPAYQVLDGIPQFVVAVGNGAAAEVWGISAQDGAVFWKYPVKIGYGLCTSPVVDGSRVLLAAGEPGQEFLIALQMFVTDGKVRALPVFSRNDTQCSQAHTLSLVAGAVFGLGNGSIECTRAADGEPLWRDKGHGWNFNQQLIVAGDLIFGVSGTDLVLLEASQKGYVELGRAKVPVKLTQQQPTLANGRLYLRGENCILCYDVKGD